MFTVERTAANRVDIMLSDKLDHDAMETALNDLVYNCDGIDNGLMLYTIGEFKMPTIGAIALELSRTPELLRLMKKFSRVAVLTDTTWMQKVSEIEGMFIPGLEIKAFYHSQSEVAEAWLNS